MSHLPWYTGTNLIIVAGRNDATLKNGIIGVNNDNVEVSVLVYPTYERLLQ